MKIKTTFKTECGFFYISYFEYMSQNFSKKEIREFSELVQKEYQVTLPDDQLLDFMTHVFKLVKHAYLPVNKKQYEEIKNLIEKKDV